MTSYTDVKLENRSRFARYRRSLWLLTKRDLHVRYTTNVLGYLWSILEPLLMAGIYYFVFVEIFHRTTKTHEDPYIIFMLAALLPWFWFNGAVSDSTRTFFSQAKLIRSTMIPRTIWVYRLVLSKGIEFVLSLPVLVIFALVYRAPIHIEALYYPLAIVMQAVFTAGIGLIVAPLVVFYRDIERAVKLILRLMFYASPVVYSALDIPTHLHLLNDLNPLAGIFSLYRAAFFPQELNWELIGSSALISVIVLCIGLLVYSRSIRSVLKEI